MRSREIIKALLNKEIPERVGLHEHFWPHIIQNAWGEQGMESGTNFVEHFGLDIQGLHFFNARGPRPDLSETIEETDEWAVTRNAWGASFKYWKKKAGTPEHVGFSVTTPDIWKNEFRDAFLAMDMGAQLDITSLRERYTEAMASDRFVTFSGLFVFEQLRGILGDIAMLEALLLEPEWIKDFCDCFTQKAMEHFEVMFREVGLPDGVHIYEDLGYTAAPFASPACHREMIHPHHVKLFNMFKDYNLPIIMHTCGDFRPHLPCIVESGVDCIQAMEAKTGMDVVELAKTYKNDLCFMGNINIQVLETGDRDKIREECLGKLTGMKELRAPYIYMSDHSIPPSVALDDYRYMLELYHDNCNY